MIIAFSLFPFIGIGGTDDGTMFGPADVNQVFGEGSPLNGLFGSFTASGTEILDEVCNLQKNSFPFSPLIFVS